jgi:NAD-dependent dihydropyrimidine dehydrogenase PreA subunit
MLRSLDENICTGCQICVDACPEDVLRYDNNKRKAVIAYPKDCIGCGVCSWFCPVKCIETSIEREWPQVQAY